LEDTIVTTQNHSTINHRSWNQHRNHHLNFKKPALLFKSLLRQTSKQLTKIYKRFTIKNNAFFAKHTQNLITNTEAN